MALIRAVFFIRPKKTWLPKWGRTRRGAKRGVKRVARAALEKGEGKGVNFLDPLLRDAFSDITAF